VPQTFDDLADICSTLTSNGSGIVPMFEAGGSAWPTQIMPGLMYMSSAQLDGNWAQQVVDKETTFDEEGGPFVEGLTIYKQFQNDGCFNSDAVTAQFEDGIAAVSNGSAAMMALPTGLIDQFTAQLGDDVDLMNETIGFAYPSAEGAVSAWAPNVAGTWYVPKTGDADRESTALAFIQWATGEGYQGFVDESGTFPVLEGADSPDVVGFRAEVQAAYEDSTAYAFNSNLVGFNSEFPNYMTGILSDSLTPEEAAASAQTAFAQAAQAAGLPGW
jgi:raffinose/stachyose/melibiose transport system substrate-binding protein